MIPSEPVPTGYKRTRDEVIKPGHQLAEGMVVLIDNPDARIVGDELAKLDEVGRARVRTVACWCKVENLQRGEQYIEFTGVYADGMRRQRRYHLNKTWLVKKGT